MVGRCRGRRDFGRGGADGREQGNVTLRKSTNSVGIPGIEGSQTCPQGNQLVEVCTGALDPIGALRVGETRRVGRQRRHEGIFALRQGLEGIRVDRLTKNDSFTVLSDRVEIDTQLNQ